MTTSEKREKYLEVHGEPRKIGDLTYWFARTREELEIMIDMAGEQDSIDHIESVIEERGIWLGYQKSIAIMKNPNGLYCVVSNSDIINLMKYGWN